MTHKITQKKWILIIFSFILIIGTGIFFDLKDVGYFIDESNILLETDKNPNNSEQIGSLYRNKKYKFRIKFPEGWISKEGDGRHIVRKAANTSGASINIGIFELATEIEKFKLDIHDIPVAEFFEYVQNEFPDAKLINSGFTKIDNKNAYYIEYITSYQALDIKTKLRQKQWFIMHNNILYVITVGSPEDLYAKFEPDFLKSVVTFVFED